MQADQDIGAGIMYLYGRWNDTNFPPTDSITGKTSSISSSSGSLLASVNNHIPTILNIIILIKCSFSFLHPQHHSTIMSLSSDWPQSSQRTTVFRFAKTSWNTSAHLWSFQKFQSNVPYCYSFNPEVVNANLVSSVNIKFQFHISDILYLSLNSRISRFKGVTQISNTQCPNVKSQISNCVFFQRK